MSSCAAVTAAALLAAPATASVRSGAPAATVQSPPGLPGAVVALGDSYSSGLGAGGYEDDCDRTPRAWAMQVFGDAVTERTLLACSGAEIPQVRRQVDRLAAMAGDAGDRLVTVTVGGNDIGFADELVNCLTPFVSCLDREPVIAGRIDALHDPLVELYDDVQAAAPGDEVIVGGYPMLVPDPSVRSDCSALTGLLSAPERRMIRRLGVELNDAVDAAAAEAGVGSAATELEQVFDGHEACDNESGDWLYGLKLSWPYGAQAPGLDRRSPAPQPESAEARWDVLAGFVSDSFHPNRAGQAGYATAFERAWFSG
ncbi:GDSL-like lipase/acylhydrolase family protein [Haloactinopolyspora alba]|uniref:GDSL-like lipase/acylhydrolase family protein n=1 Tax=Haloactinopolyspora alba TaxID=648780 RepID=A0A2P8DKZ3_9ACTN|nr:SGNH/GDSL hydrolase family protein [Haloactinopolyspora alba]PSK97897.1 GDSL-like lipase/acylhydrolase family protein [Haloactinopolyspora alba]